MVVLLMVVVSNEALSTGIVGFAGRIYIRYQSDTGIG